MAPSTDEASADGAESVFQRHAWLLPLVFTPVLLLPVLDRPVEPIVAALACAAGGVAGAALAAVLDRFRSRLQEWNDALVVVGFVVPLLLALFGMRFLLGRGVIVYQSIGMLGLLWGVPLKNVVR